MIFIYLLYYKILNKNNYLINKISYRFFKSKQLLEKEINLFYFVEKLLRILYY